MKKILSIVAISVAILTITTGCSTKSGQLEMGSHLEGSGSICKTAIYAAGYNNKKVLDSIKVAGEKNGWKMTPFKVNSMIAEKPVSGKTVSATIAFEKDHITCDKGDVPNGELEDLRQAIVDELKKPIKH